MRLLLSVLATAALLSPAVACADPNVDSVAVVKLTAPQATSALGESLTPGTVIFSKGACLYVTAYTGSDITHVGIVADDENGQPVVFDSMKGSGVRSSSVAAYLEEMKDAELLIYRPVEPLAKPDRDRLRLALSDDLGRPYDVAHYLTGRPSEGLHCSEYVTETLSEVGYLRSGRPSDVAPGQLADGISMMRRWGDVERIQLIEPDPVKPTGLSCCESFWWDTKECVSETGDWFSGVFFCR